MALSRVAAIFDIHGNTLALEAVLNEVARSGADAIVVGGDLSWGPEPAQTMRSLRSLGGTVHFVRGNTDRGIAGRYGTDEGQSERSASIIRWCREQLSGDDLQFLGALPLSVQLEIQGLITTAKKIDIFFQLRQNGLMNLGECARQQRISYETGGSRISGGTSCTRRPRIWREPSR